MYHPLKERGFLLKQLQLYF